MTLKTGVIILKIQLCFNRHKLHFTIYGIILNYNIISILFLLYVLYVFLPDFYFCEINAVNTAQNKKIIALHLLDMITW